MILLLCLVLKYLNVCALQWLTLIKHIVSVYSFTM